MKRVTRELINRNWLQMITAFIISLVIISLTMIYSDSLHTKLTSKRFESYIKEEKKKEIKREVKNRIDEIEYEQSVLQRNFNELIKEKIIKIEILLLSSEHIKRGSIDQVIQEYERLFSADSEYLYFALSSSGILLRSGTDSKIHGNDIRELRDKDGVFFTKEMLKSIDREDGIYTTYHWPKVKNGPPLKKTSYTRYIPELDIIIGTGVYEEDMFAQLKESIYSRLIDYYRNSESYIFVTDFQGVSKVHSNPTLIGKSLLEYRDYNNTPINEQMMEIISSRGSGFLTYPFLEKNSDLISEKISYVESLGDKWGAYIGMGFHTKELKIELMSYEQEFQDEHFKEFVLSLILFILMALVMVYFIKRAFQLQKEYLKQEELIFEELFEISPEPIIIVSKGGELLFENRHNRRIFKEGLDKQISHDGRLIHEHIKDNTIRVVHENRREYIVEYRTENIIYNNIDSYVYFLKDITNDYFKSSELLKQAHYDELTGLPNRRKLFFDIESLEEDQKDENLAIVMLDLDHFKNINDNYGHDMGDKILKSLAAIIQGRLRNSDVIYRYGGEEFVLLLRSINLDHAKKILEFLNSSFSSRCSEEYHIHISFSAGVILTHSNTVNTESIETLITQADKLLYKAKEMGRNRIETEL